MGDVLSGKLLVYNMLNNEQQKFEFSKADANTIDELAFENRDASDENSNLEILASEALEQMHHPNVVFLDVRNWDENPKIVIENSIQIPLDILEKEIWKLNFGSNLFAFCQSGIRSKKAVEILRKHHFKNAKSIIGGAKALEKINCKTVSTF
jgi:adenylyltransferase/sulfurtransferase